MLAGPARQVGNPIGKESQGARANQKTPAPPITQLFGSSQLLLGENVWLVVPDHPFSSRETDIE